MSQVFDPGPKTLIGKRYEQLKVLYDALHHENYHLKHENIELRKRQQKETYYQEAQQHIPQIIETTTNIIQVYETLKKERTVDNAHIVQNQIQEAVPNVLQFTINVAEGKIPAPLSTQLRAAFFLLGIAGHSPIHKIQAIHTTLTKEDLERIKSRGLEAIKTQAQLSSEIELPHTDYTDISNDSPNQKVDLLRRKLKSS